MDRQALLASLLLIGGLLANPVSASAAPTADLPSGFVEEFFSGGFPDPTALAFAPDGRLFVAGQRGELWIAEEGEAEARRPLITLDVNDEGERGLVGLALDPRFSENRLLYVQYTAPGPPVRNRVSRLELIGNRIPPDSEQILIELDPQEAVFHAGGALAFGDDGKLYVGTGDNTRAATAQQLESLLGKVLRLNPDGSIPADNPFYQQTEGVNRAIYAMGLRNVFSIALDRSTGRMFANDTGEVDFEEINLLEPGANYGWPETEGYTDLQQFHSPEYAYPHGADGDEVGCAIAGGAFYDHPEPSFPPEYRGRYMFVDYCADWIRILDDEGSAMTFAHGLRLRDAGASEIVGLAIGPDGSVYWLSRLAGAVYRIRYADDRGPFIGQHPLPQRAEAGSAATFQIRASGTGELSFQWQRNREDIAGATESTLVVAALPEDDGADFRCIVTSSLGRATSTEAELEVIPPAAAYQSRPPLVWRAGEPKGYEVTLTNLGKMAWNASGLNQVRLGISFGGASEAPDAGWVTDRRIALPSNVAPGESVSFRVEVEAPRTSGAFVLRHWLVKEGVTWFPEPQAFEVSVEPSPDARVLISLGAALIAVGAGVLVWTRRQWLRGT